MRDGSSKRVGLFCNIKDFSPDAKNAKKKTEKFDHRFSQINTANGE